MHMVSLQAFTINFIKNRNTQIIIKNGICNNSNNIAIKVLDPTSIQTKKNHQSGYNLSPIIWKYLRMDRTYAICFPYSFYCPYLEGSILKLCEKPYHFLCISIQTIGVHVTKHIILFSFC